MDYLRQLPSSGTWDDEEILSSLIDGGIEENLAWMIIGLVPIFAGRILMDGVGPTFQDQVDLISPDSASESYVLSTFPPYIAICEASEKVVSHPNMQTLALVSAEVHAVNDLLNSGSQPTNLILTPPALLLRG